MTLDTGGMKNYLYMTLDTGGMKNYLYMTLDTGGMKSPNTVLKNTKLFLFYV